MIKTIWPYTKGYRFKSILAALTIIGEVLVEVSIPYMMADIVNIGIENKDTAFIIQRGIMMILMAIASLSLGALSARFASVSSAGFAKNLRGGLFEQLGTPNEVFQNATRLTEIGLAVPQITALFLRLRELGIPVDPATYTVSDAVRQLLLLKGGKADA